MYSSTWCIGYTRATRYHARVHGNILISLTQQISKNHLFWDAHLAVFCPHFFTLKSVCHWRQQPKAKNWLSVSPNGCQWQPGDPYCWALRTVHHKCSSARKLSARTRSNAENVQNIQLISHSCKLITPLKDTPSLAQLRLGSDSDTGPSDPAGDKETNAMHKIITDSHKHSKW